MEFLNLDPQTPTVTTLFASHVEARAYYTALRRAGVKAYLLTVEPYSTPDEFTRAKRLVTFDVPVGLLDD